MKNKSPQTDTLITRPPVVVVMGHIDHGKSTLLDYIRKTKTTESEAGGITQHVSAYEAEHKTSDGVSHTITFLDTPGHEAFRALRERGAQVADIAILVVSAEDGVKPQTIEVRKVILESNIPYIVAVTKIDKPSADLERTKQSLAENEIYVEGYGGTVPIVAVSAKTGEGIPELLEMIELVAGLSDIKANTEKLAEGVAIESNLDPKKGISATLIIKDGTLKSGMFVASGKATAPVRIMENSVGKNIREATFSSPVRIFGWSELVEAGSIFKTFKNKQDALAYSTKHTEESLEKTRTQKNQENSGEVVSSATETPKTIFPIVIKADTVGTLEAVVYEIEKINKEEKITIKILGKSLGTIGEGDIKTASADKNAVVVGFNVKTDSAAKSLIDRDSVVVKNFSIIYELKDWVASELIKRTPKTKFEEITGKARILKVFSKTRDKQIIGGKVDQGFLAIGEHIKIVRRENDIGTGRIRELQQQKQSVKEVKEGSEFGAMVESKIEIAHGDSLVSFEIVEK